MINYKKVITEKLEIESITCDICKKKYEDDMELQEFLNINFVGGYLSIFGDEESFECNICQYCLKEKLGDSIRKIKYTELSDKPYIEIETKKIDLLYNKDYGDDRMCICGHPYYRHFDPFDNDAAVGCKYCVCYKFKEDKSES